jgi:methylated-DNA-protein-cysteine methyltransferase-like protein
LTYGGEKRILDMVRAIPEGFVRTYGDICPAAPRVVGQVLSRTSERMPWHRVVRADGGLPLGAEQQALLEAEDVPVEHGKVVMDDARLPVMPGDMPD